MAKDYLAEITGTDPTYKLARRFVKPDQLIKGNPNFYVQRINDETEYFLLTETGDRVHFTYDQVLNAFYPSPNPVLNSPNLLRPYQIEGANYLASHKRAYLADDMGLGKTRQALAAIQAFPVVIVCPASVKFIWKEEAEAMLPDHSVSVLSSKTPDYSKIHAKILIINFDIFESWQLALESIPIQTLIVDEVHYLSNGRAARTRAVRSFALNMHPEYRYLLSGTPMANGPVNLYNQLLIASRLPYAYKKWDDFTERYCAPEYNGFGTEYASSNELELKRHLDTFMLRRMKSEVLTDLPERAEYSLPLPVDISQDYRSAHNEFVDWYYNETGKDLSHSDAKFLVRFGKLAQIAELDVAESAAFREWLDNFESPIVIAYRYRETTKPALQRYFGNTACYFDGTCSASEKQEMVDDFQHGKYKAFVGQMDAVKTGLTLTRADTIILLTVPWTPADYAQIQDRIYRIGQKNACSTYLVKTHSIHSYMREIFLDKAKTISTLVKL